METYYFHHRLTQGFSFLHLLHHHALRGLQPRHGKTQISGVCVAIIIIIIIIIRELSLGACGDSHANKDALSKHLNCSSISDECRSRAGIVFHKVARKRWKIWLTLLLNPNRKWLSITTSFDDLEWRWSNDRNVALYRISLLSEMRAWHSVSRMCTLQFRRDKSWHLENVFEHFKIFATTWHALLYLTRIVTHPHANCHEFFPACRGVNRLSCQCEACF